MGRNKIQRLVWKLPKCTTFVPSDQNQTIVQKIYLDEYEAIKLADVEGLTMKEAAEKLWISAATFCRILASARKKIGLAIVHGETLSICLCEKKDS